MPRFTISESTTEFPEQDILLEDTDILIEAAGDEEHAEARVTVDSDILRGDSRADKLHFAHD